MQTPRSTVSLVLVIPPGGRHASERRIALRGEPVEIGGASDCDAVIEHPSVGTARVRIERLDDEWIAVDREGRGLCSVGGVPLRPREPRVVRPPHAIRLGDVDLELAFDTGDSNANVATREVALRAAAFVADAAPPWPRVRIVEGPRRGETLDLARETVYRVGRGKDCDLLLDADDASRAHLTIERQASRVVVRDMGSARGTFLGRSRLEPNRAAVWEPSRMLRITDTVLSLETADAMGAARLLRPLERLRDPPAPSAAPAQADLAPSASTDALAPSDVHPALDETASEGGRPGIDGLVAPTSPATEIAHPPKPRRTRDPTFVLVLLAAVFGVAGVVVLLFLVLS